MVHRKVRDWPLLRHDTARDAGYRRFPHPNCRQRPGLSKEESIFGSRNPAILGWDSWFGGRLRLKVDPDGNCFGVSWMVASLLSAVQTPRSLDEFIGKLKEAAQPSGAFSIVPTSVQVKWPPHLLCSTKSTLGMQHLCSIHSRPFSLLLSRILRVVGVAGSIYVDGLGGVDLSLNGGHAT